MQDALALPNLVARGDSFNAEADKFAPGVVDGAGRSAACTWSRASARTPACTASRSHDGMLEGGADPRREGVARGF